MLHRFQSYIFSSFSFPDEEKVSRPRISSGLFKKRRQKVVNIFLIWNLTVLLWVSWKSARRALTVLLYIVVVKFSAKVTYHILNPLWSSFEKGKLLNWLLKFAPKVRKEKTETFLPFSEGLIWIKIYIVFWSKPRILISISLFGTYLRTKRESEHSERSRVHFYSTQM